LAPAAPAPLEKIRKEQDLAGKLQRRGKERARRECADMAKKRVRIQPWRILVLLLILWVGFSFARGGWENLKLKRQIEALEKQLIVLEMRKEDLEREIEEWRSPENVERVAREQLGLVKPGEVVYRVSESFSGDVAHDVGKR
jgi:cell division protein FtsL